MLVASIVVYRQLEEMAKRRGVTVQEFLRAVVFPEWFAYDKTRAQINAIGEELKAYLKMRDRNRRRRRQRDRRR